jgi:cytochrome d ubiquinol oxidase subunit II
MIIELSTIWAALIAFGLLAYVVLDGFDLGVGILFPLFPKRADRDVMMNSVAPVWDGNETWLVLGGGGLLAAFPLAYAVVFPALYMPLILMLLGLVLRGVAFEFRWRTERGRFLWDAAFIAGSLLAALMQGVALGALVQGIEVSDRAYAGAWWDWLTPFSISTGLALVMGYALLGASWLVMKTEHALRDRARRLALIAGVATLALIGGVSVWTPFLADRYFDRWFAWPTMIFSGVVPLLLLGCAGLFYWGLKRERDAVPFVAALGFFILCYAGIGISFYPEIVPGALTIAEAASPDASLEFMLWGAGFLLPIILIYTGFAYWVFRGKVRPGEGYH